LSKHILFNSRFPSSWTLTKSHEDIIAELGGDQIYSELNSPFVENQDQENQENCSKLPKMKTRRALGMIN
jgi:hypothetical protein